MAIGIPTLATPVASAGGTPVSTAPFTPTLGALLLAFGCSRAAVLQSEPTIGSTALTWTPLASNVSDIGSGSRIRGRLWAAVASSNPSMTVTVASASAGKCAVAIVEVTGASGIPGNVNSAADGTGDPSVVLVNAAAASSVGVVFFAAAGIAVPTQPAGFTNLHDAAAQTDLWVNVAHIAASPPTTAAYTSGNLRSVAIYGEVAEAAGGSAAAPRPSLLFRHALLAR
jgi:hypothetical protein